VASVNEQLLDRAVRHSTFLQQFNTQQANELLEFMNTKMIPDLLKQVGKRLTSVPTGKRTPSKTETKRLVSLADANKQLVRAGFVTMKKDFTGNMKSFALSEAEFQVRLLKESMPIQFDFQVPNLTQLNKIVTTTPLRGRVLGRWFDDLSVSTVNKINSEIRIGLSLGEDVEAIVRRLKGTAANKFTDGVLNIPRRHIRTIVRTTASDISNLAREETYRQNSDVIDKVKYIATLDVRTTPICASLDNQVFDVGIGPRPPMHHQCRSTTVPITKSWKELGIKLRELPPGTRPQQLLSKTSVKQLTRRGVTKKEIKIIRSELNGQVPADLSYTQWLRQQPVAIQNEALGPTRAVLFRQGKVPIDKFVDSTFRTLTLEQLQAKEGLELTKQDILPPRERQIPSRVGVTPEINNVFVESTITKEFQPLKFPLRDEFRKQMGTTSFVPNTNSGLIHSALGNPLRNVSIDIAREDLTKEILGAISYHKNFPEIVKIEALGVLRQKQNIGRRLVLGPIDLALKSGRKLFLETNKDARKFWKSLGFEETAELEFTVKTVKALEEIRMDIVRKIVKNP